MKKQRFSLLMIGLFLATFLLSALPFAPAAQAKGIETRITLRGSAQYPNAKGTAKYKVDGANREFQVELENAKPLAGKSLDVIVNGTRIGSFTVTALGTGRLNRDTERGQNVPMISGGSRVQIKTKAGILVVSGAF